MRHVSRLLAATAAVLLTAGPALAHDNGKPHDGGWDQLMGQSEIARDLGDWANAIGLLEHSLAKASEGLPQVVSHLQLAEALIQTGKYKKAHASAKKGLDAGNLLDDLPQVRGHLLEAFAHALHKTGGDAAEVERSNNWAIKIRQDRGSPLVPRSHDFGLRHADSGFLFAANIAGFLRTNARKVSKEAPHVQGKYAYWLGDSAVFADVVIYPKPEKSLRQIFDQVRAVTMHHYKKAKRLSKGEFAAAKTLGLKGLEAQWLITEPDKKTKLWQGLYFMERKGFIVQVRTRALADEAERAEKLIDEFVRAFKWAKTIKS
ncbi:MAG: hypothetical protein CMM48_11110 [Rhodospirillaceae bacterium]|nr:hypothetical protein [Rhodospirillaceae bacterium]HAA93437.1 hypothetical protein [Rhodospirillaceae bacterium]